MRGGVFLILFWPMAAFAEMRVLAIGDSVMAFQHWTGRDIPSVVEDTLGVDVDSEARSASRFSNATGIGRALGFDVRAQYKAGDWDVVVMNGGANDLLADCGCSRCGPVVDQLINKALTGEIPTFVSQLRSRGHKVIYMGYYASARSGQFTGCRDYIVEMEWRIAQWAEGQEGVTFWDSETVMDRTDRSLFAFDGIHPSPKGARVIGMALADVIAGQ